MPVSSWNTNPDLNTTVGGVFIGEGCPPSNLNNGERQIMADVRGKFDDVDDRIAGIAGKPAISLIAPLTPAADKVPYYTGPASADLMTVTALARSVLAAGDQTTARGLVSALGAGAFQVGTNGYATLLFGTTPIIIQWGTTFGTFTEGQVTLNFAEPFPNVCWIVLPNPVVSSASNTNDYGCQLLNSPAPNSFTAMVQKFGSNGTALSGIGYIAIGG